MNNDNYFSLSKSKLINLFPLSSIINPSNLNKIQDECFDLLYKTNKTTIITAPICINKSILLELAIARIIKINYDTNNKNYINKNFKIIYISPIKKSIQEKTFEWKMKFSKNPLELNVTEFISHNNENSNINLLNNSNIILTTPKKFDELSRDWKKISNFISNISLILIDEIQLINEKNTGDNS